MKSNTTNNSGGISILTLATGAAIGAALGVLFAPEKGEETRKRIVKTARQYAEPIVETVQRRVSDAYDYAEEMIPAMKTESDYSFLTSLAVAVPIGAVLGVLFAPAKGTETRSNIAKTFSNGFSKMSESTGHLFSGAEASNAVRTPGRGNYSM
jgi:gas vesicle protein